MLNRCRHKKNINWESFYWFCNWCF